MTLSTTGRRGSQPRLTRKLKITEDDYEEVAARLAGTLAGWGCWDAAWSVPTSGGITQARQRLGFEPLRQLFGQVAVPVAELLTRGAFLGRGG